MPETPKKSVVLVVEDDEAILDYLSMTLEMEGYEVFSATDGEQGLAMIQAHKPEAVLLDLMLPKLDGFSVLKKMREGTETAQIPVVVLSAYADAESTRQGLKEATNVKRVFTKPVGSQALLDQVKALLLPK